MGVLGFFFGDDQQSRAERDQWRPSTIAKNLISPVNSYGTCFSCEGAGTRTLSCGACDGSGSHTFDCPKCASRGQVTLAVQECFACHGTGVIRGSSCWKCGGSGIFKPARTVLCSRCNGAAKFVSECRKCSGRGTFSVRCRKCDGSGWHRFKS